MKNINCKNCDYAPIVIFAFNRPEHLSSALNALSKNSEFKFSPLFIYCDGPRYDLDTSGVNQTRAIANQWPHPNKTVIESDINQGIATSVISGVTKIIKNYGKIIVLEDDLVVDISFLNFLNQALIKFKDNRRIMQISAYMFPIPEFLEKKETFCLSNISSWGWATWDHAWANFDPNASGWELLLQNKALRRKFDVGGSYAYSDMLFRQKIGKIDSWAIRWNWTVFRHSGLVVYPPVSLVNNIGFDGSGTHCVEMNVDVLGLKPKMPIRLSSNTNLSKTEILLIQAALKKLNGPIYLRFIKLQSNNLRRLKIKFRNLINNCINNRNFL